MRIIKTKYYTSKHAHPDTLIRTNSSTNANRAVGQAVTRMADDDYPGAVLAEVYDDEFGVLHAQIVKSPSGDAKIAYKRDPKKYADRLAASALI